MAVRHAIGRIKKTLWDILDGEITKDTGVTDLLLCRLS